MTFTRFFTLPVVAIDTGRIYDALKPIQGLTCCNLNAVLAHTYNRQDAA